MTSYRSEETKKRAPLLSTKSQHHEAHEWRSVMEAVGNSAAAMTSEVSENQPANSSSHSETGGQDVSDC
jgi:hypothetical protein